jgi:hypothetical protein
MFTSEEKSELRGAIDRLNYLWPTQRSWEKKAASVTTRSEGHIKTCTGKLLLASYYGPFVCLIQVSLSTELDLGTPCQY